WGFKVDHAFSSKNKINYSIAHTGYYDLSFTPFTGPLSSSNRNDFKLWITRLSQDYFIRPNIINHGTIGYNRTDVAYAPADALFGCPKQIGLTGVNEGSV